MNRDDTIQKYFQKAGELTVSKKFYRDHITQLFLWMIKADAVKDDITSQILSLRRKGKMQIIAKQNGVIAGIEELSELLAKHTNLVFIPIIMDGARVEKEALVVQISGESTQLLAYERTILNILGRMSGIATETDVLVSSIKNMTNAPYLAAIRKTPLMMIDKKAVAVGGGLTHRLNLADSILIKDNHLGLLQKELGLKTSEKAAAEAVIRCMQSNAVYFEIEVDSLSQANTLIHAFIKENTKLKQSKMMAILLDNFQPVDAKKFVNSLKKLPVYNSLLIEGSGEINKTNLADWAATGVDIVSLGALTHSPKVFNFSMAY